jgi:NAD(P)-dependent dehydrogenase (short-subunit alcohol dehydrogenase family)
VGRGIALAFGEAGATVYCTGRSSRAALASGAEPLSGQERSKALPAEYYTGRPETIEETAELVTARGGKGIAVVVDHWTSVRSRNWWPKSGPGTESYTCW